MRGLDLIRRLDHLRMAAFHGRRDQRVTILESTGRPRWGRSIRTGDRAQRQGPSSASSPSICMAAEMISSRSRSPCPRALGRRGQRKDRPRWRRSSPDLRASRPCAAVAPDDTIVHVMTVVQITQGTRMPLTLHEEQQSSPAHTSAPPRSPHWSPSRSSTKAGTCRLRPHERRGAALRRDRRDQRPASSSSAATVPPCASRRPTLPPSPSWTGSCGPILAVAGAALILRGDAVLGAFSVSGGFAPGKTTNAQKPRLPFSLPSVLRQARGDRPRCLRVSIPKHHAQPATPSNWRVCCRAWSSIAPALPVGCGGTGPGEQR